ncbi:MAG: LiaI-LiaF-like domain-containing protein [Eubacteriales bacterium]
MKNKNLIFGLILIAIGSLWFLDNLNWIDFSIQYLFRGILDLWPITLVLLGISIMFNNKKVVRIIWIAFLIILISYSMFIQYNGSIFYRSNESSRIVNNYESHNYSVSLDEDIKKGVLDIDLGATKFEIKSSNIDNLIHLDSDFPGLKYNSFKEDASIQKCTIDYGNFNFNINDDYSFTTDIVLNNAIPWDIDIDCGAVDGTVDLREAKLESLDLDMGAGKLDLQLGNNTENGKVYIDSGVSNIDIDVPNDAGIKISLDGALNSTNLSSLGLNHTDGFYISDNYDTAETKYEFDVSMGLGKFNINYNK